MNQIPHSHPLDKLISDDRLFLLEAILPFVEGPMRMPLVIYLKMMELQQIMRVINNQSYIRQCDFNRDLHNQNDILKDFVFYLFFLQYHHLEYENQ